jgi:hypothetical protein
LLAQAQEQWLEAARYLAQALQVFVEFQDEYYVGVTRDNLRRLWQAHPDEALLAVMAGVLGVAVEEVRGWLTTADGDSSGLPPA